MQISLQLFTALVQALQHFGSSSSLAHEVVSLYFLTGDVLHTLFKFLSGRQTQVCLGQAIPSRTSASDQRLSAALRQQLQDSDVLAWLPGIMHAAVEEVNECATQVCGLHV